MKELRLGQEPNKQIIDILKRRILPWMAGKGAGDTEAYGMDSSVNRVVRIEMMPKNSALLDRPDIVASDHLLIHDPLKQTTG